MPRSIPFETVSSALDLPASRLASLGAHRREKLPRRPLGAALGAFGNGIVERRALPATCDITLPRGAACARGCRGGRKRGDVARGPLVRYCRLMPQVGARYPRDLTAWPTAVPGDRAASSLRRRHLRARGER